MGYPLLQRLGTAAGMYPSTCLLRVAKRMIVCAALREFPGQCHRWVAAQTDDKALSQALSEDGWRGHRRRQT
jgi:hypothetical protein